MRALLIVVLIACGGSRPPPAAPVSNATPVVAAPEPPQPASRCGCTSERCREQAWNKYALAKMCSFRDDMCSCKDKACADHVNEGFTNWMQDMAKNARTDHNSTEDEAKAMADSATQYQECYTKLSDGSTGP
jgi:hypothetical protein